VKHRKMVFCAALFVVVFAVPGRHQEVAAQLPTSAEVHNLHAKLFDQRTGRGALLQRAAREGDLHITTIPEVGMLSPNAGPRPDLDFAKSITCGADIVVMGVEESSQSFLTESQEWVFTDNVVSIREILKDNVLHALLPGSTIIVARSGGSIDTPDGHHIVVADLDDPTLYTGSTYVLALKYVPSTGQYWQFDHRSAFHVLDKRALSLISQNKGAQEPHYDYDYNVLSGLVRQYAAECATPERK